MAVKRTLDAIRRNLDSHVGERVRVRSSEGRRRTLEKEGILEKTYPSIFVVKLDEADGRYVSWSYADVLTDAVEIEFPDTCEETRKNGTTGAEARD